MREGELRQPKAGHRGGLEPVAERQGGVAEVEHDAAHEALAGELLECAQAAEVRLTRRSRRSDFHSHDVPGRIFDDDVDLSALGALLETFVVNELQIPLGWARAR